MLDDIICEECKGTGIRGYFEGSKIECEFCEGKGSTLNHLSYFWRRNNR